MTKKPLNILLVYDCVCPESLGGVEHRNFRLAKALAARGHRVTLAGWTGTVSDTHPNITVLPMVMRSKIYDGAGKRTALTSLKFAVACCGLNLRPFDVVETANIPYIHLFPLAFLSVWHRKPLMISWYEFWGNTWFSYKSYPKAIVYRLAEWFCAQLGRTVSSISPFTTERLKNVRWRSGVIHEIACGVALESIRDAKTKPAPDFCPPLVYAGRLMREKRLDLLLNAVARMSAPCDSVLLDILGDGPDRARLEDLAAHLGLGQKVRFKGRLPTAEDVWSHMAHARIAVQPSAREGFGLFALEAMALGLPVVHCLSPDSAVDSLVQDGGVGVKAKAETLADALQSLLQDQHTWNRLSVNARRRAEVYDWNVLAERAEFLFYAMAGSD